MSADAVSVSAAVWSVVAASLCTEWTAKDVVARVISYEELNALGLARRLDLSIVRRGEDAAGCSGVEHALTDQARVQRIVAGPTARDETDATLR